MAINWERYHKVINDFNAEAAQAEFIWKRRRLTISRDGEDADVETYDNITLKGLFQFNTFRTWPITEFTETGQEDKQSQVLWLNLKYLTNLGYVNQHGLFNFDPTSDIFDYLGNLYEASGDTPAAQAHDKPLMFMIVLKRINGPEA